MGNFFKIRLTAKGNTAVKNTCTITKEVYVTIDRFCEWHRIWHEIFGVNEDSFTPISCAFLEEYYLESNDELLINSAEIKYYSEDDLPFTITSFRKKTWNIGHEETVNSYRFNGVLNVIDRNGEVLNSISIYKVFSISELLSRTSDSWEEDYSIWPDFCRLESIHLFSQCNYTAACDDKLDDDWDTNPRRLREEYMLTLEREKIINTILI